MMNLLALPFKFALGCLVLALLAPFLFYLFCLFLPVLFIMVLVLLLFPGRLKDGTTKVKALAECVRMAGPILVAAAACRAIMVLVYGRLPSALQHLDGMLPPDLALGLGRLPPLLTFLDRPLMQAVPLFGPGFVPWFDLVLAGLGLFATIVQGLLDGAWRVLTARQIDNLPMSRARSVALGLAELAGKARPLEGEDASRPILRYAWDRAGDTVERKEEVRPFYLEDATGRILVDPDGSEFPAFFEGRKKHGDLPVRIFGLRVCEVLLTRRFRKTASALGEAVLMPGDDVYVIGSVEKEGRRSPAGAGRSEGKVIRPRRGAFGRFGFHDVFFLSDVREIRAREYFYSGIRYAIASALSISALCAGLALFAWESRHDMRAAYGYEAPADAHRSASADTPVTPIRKRSIGIPYLGTKTVDEMLVIVREGPPGNMLTVLPLLEALGARDLAIPELRRVRKEANDPDRVRVAESWLSRWADRPGPAR